MPEPSPISPEAAERLAILGRWLWRSSFAPGNRELFDRMKNPRPGDVVLEVTKLGPFDPESVGVLVETGGEPGDGWYLVEPLIYGPGRRVRWANAEFVALPNRVGTDWTV